MKINKTIVRMTALSALVMLSACSGAFDAPQPPQAAHDPWETFKLGTVYDCDQIATPDIRINPQNLPTPDFGCAHQSNITLSVANPEDLHTPRALTPGDPIRSQRVLDAYRAGESTATVAPVRGTQELIE